MSAPTELRFAYYLESNTENEAGLFKTVKLNSDEQLMELTKKLDSDQRMVLDVTLNYSRQIQLSRKLAMNITPRLIIIQGGNQNNREENYRYLYR